MAGRNVNIVADRMQSPHAKAAGILSAAEAVGLAAEDRSLLLDLPGPALQLLLCHARADGIPGACFLAAVCSSLRAAAKQLSSELVAHLHINELLEESHWRIQTIRATTPTLLYQPALAAAADALEEAQEQHQLQEAAAYAKATSLGTWLLQYAGCVECLRVTIACSQGFLPTRRLEMPILQALQEAAAAAAGGEGGGRGGGGREGPPPAAAVTGGGRGDSTAAAAGSAGAGGRGPGAVAGGRGAATAVAEREGAAAGERGGDLGPAAASAVAGPVAAVVAGTGTPPAARSSTGSNLPLRRLQLAPLLTTPAAAQALACCRQLRELSLTLHFTYDSSSSSSSSIAPSTPSSSSAEAWCGALQQLSALQRLALVVGRQPLHTQQLEQLVQHLPAGLQALDLTYPTSVQLSSSSIAHLGVLRTLRLSGVQFKHGTQQQLGCLTALTAVEHGQLNQEPCDTLQAPVLGDLYVVTISTACLQQLRGASHLQGLHVSLALPKHPGVLGALRLLQQLQWLRLGKLLRWQSEEVAAQGWGEALSGLSQLRELQLPQRLLVTSKGRDWLQALDKLLRLEVSFYDVEVVRLPSSATRALSDTSRMAAVVAALKEVPASKLQLQALTFTQFSAGQFNSKFVSSVAAAMAAVCPGVQCRCVPSEAVVSPCQVMLE